MRKKLWRLHREWQTERAINFMSLKLHIIRHAKASQQDFFPGDFYRTLEKTGYAEASLMASLFISQHNKPEILITSPAIRAYSTCLIFAEKLSVPTDKIILHSSIYEASVASLIRVIQEVDVKIKEVALFGHNPGFTDLINYICGPVMLNLSTAGIATVQLNALSWPQVGKDTGKLIATAKP
jgi:phosphohistidine phosphatase